VSKLAKFEGLAEGGSRTSEKLVFPFLNQKLDFSQEVEQHKIIHGWLDAVIDFIRAAEADQSKFDATKLKRLMDALRDPLARRSLSCSPLDCH
jgi:hypothetical protein